MMRVALVLGLSLAFCVGVAVFPSPAAACSQSAPCHGEAAWNPSGSYTGVLADITATRMTTVTSSDWVMANLWLITDEVDSGWIENGIIRGYGGGVRWFAAEQCPRNRGAQVYNQDPVSLGTTYESKISFNVNSWAMYRNGQFLANSSTCHNIYVDFAEAGGESTHTSNTLTGTNARLQKRGGGTWSSNWGGSWIVTESNMTASWITTWASVRYAQN
jgi:hypothetical protein